MDNAQIVLKVTFVATSLSFWAHAGATTQKFANDVFLGKVNESKKQTDLQSLRSMLWW